MTTSPFTFRRAGRDDLEAIITLLADDDLGQSRERVSTPIDPAYLSAFDAIQADPNQYLAVLEDDLGVAGCLQLSFIPGLSRLGLWRGQIESVRIAGRRRGDGLGRRMIEWAIEQFRLKQCGLVQLSSDKARSDALKFYETLGFVASHEGLKLAL